MCCCICALKTNKQTNNVNISGVRGCVVLQIHVRTTSLRNVVTDSDATFFEVHNLKALANPAIQFILKKIT